MITQEHEYYIRFILLLLEVGTDLLREITEKALQRIGQTLSQFLNSAKPALLNDKHLTQTQKYILYPPNQQVAAINDFDITLLSHLLISYLNGFIDNNERKGVNDIRHLRNNHHAHATEGKMDIVTFTREWNCLATIICYAGNGLSPEVQQRHIDMTASIEKDQLDNTAVAEQLKKLDQSGVFFKNIQTRLDDMNRDQKQLVVEVENVQIKAKKTEVEVAALHNGFLEIKTMMYKLMENQGTLTKVVQNIIIGSDNPVEYEVRKSVDEGKRSVGLLIDNGRPCGTAFRVGSKFLVTALYYVNSIKDLYNNEVCVDFNSSLLLPQRQVYHLTNRKVFDQNLDFVILEISDLDEHIPEALELDKEIHDISAEMNSVYMIGYGHPDKLEKSLNSDCTIISAQALRILDAEAEKRLIENKSDYIFAWKFKGHDPDLVNIGYRGINIPEMFHFYCNLEHGDSGAPLVTTVGAKDKVVGILIHELPNF